MWQSQTFQISPSFVSHNGVNIFGFPCKKSKVRKLKILHKVANFRNIQHNPRGYPHLLSRTKVHVLRNAASRHFNKDWVVIGDV